MSSPVPASTSDALLEHLAQLPFITEGVPAITGKLRATPEDFEVEEVAAYEASGTGEHLYLWIEKRGLNTPDAARLIAQQLDLPPQAASWAGLKDRHAVTRQWLSFHTPKTPAEDQLKVEGVSVLKVTRHGNKLRTGHLHGNRFTLRLRDVPEGDEHHAGAAFSRIAQIGLPNYFGAQRFGHGGNNLRHAYRWIAERGKAPPNPFLRKLNVSVLQSGLFNAWLGTRVRENKLAEAVVGDVMRKEETGGLFVSEDAQIDGPRVTAWEISPTGPMFGASMRAPAQEALEMESSVLAAWGVTEAHLSAVKKYGEGTRRVARIRPQGVQMNREGPHLMLRFELPKGSYATVLVAELMKNHNLDLSDGES